MKCALTASTWTNNRSEQPRSSGHSGFTLLEILVAMMILTIVLGMIFSSFDGVFSDAGHIRTGSEIHEMAQACLERISLDLQAIHVKQTPRYKQPEMDSDPDIYRIQGSNDAMGGSEYAKLRFTSLDHLPLGGDARLGIAEIVYYVHDAPDGSYELRRADHLYPYPEEFEPNDADPVMCDQVRSFKLLFYDREGREYQAWDSEDDDFDYSTPQMVAIELKVGEEEMPYEFKTAVTLPMRRQIEPKR